MTRPSPWGLGIAVADAHVHFFSHRFFEGLLSQIEAAQKPGVTLDSLHWQMPPVEAEDLANIWAHELDRQGVARAALMASAPGDDESVLKAAAAFPGRFFAYAMVNPVSWKPSDVDAACLFPAMHRYSVQSDDALRVFEWAKENRKVVFVHCGVLSVGVRKKLGLDSLYDMRFSNPIDLHAVAMRYPSVPIVVPHFGAGYFREALMLADLCPNVYLDTSSSNQWVKYEGMRYQESHLDLRQVFRRALEVVGPRRLLFGTDSSFFPRGWHHQIFEDQAKALYELNVSEEDAKSIFGENLLRILAH